MQRLFTSLVPALLAALMGCVAPFPGERDARALGLVPFSVTAATGRLRCWRGGDARGPRVLFVHGTPGEGAQWADFLAPAPAGWETLAYDRPGFGESESRGAVPALERQVAALRPLLVRRRGVGTVLVGHSLGAPIAALAAARYPERVDGLVLIAGSMDPELEELRWYNHLVRRLPYLFPRVLRNANDEILPLRDELSTVAPALATLTCPVLIVHGREDTLVPFANVEWTRSRLVRSPSVTELVFSEAGHLLIWREPCASHVRAALGEFLTDTASVTFLHDSAQESRRGRGGIPEPSRGGR